MKITKDWLVSAAVLSLAACAQNIELNDDGGALDAPAQQGDGASRDGASMNAGDGAASMDGAAQSADASLDGASSMSDADGGSSAIPDGSASAVDAAPDADGSMAPLVCSAGTANCNGVYADGCETNLNTVTNCGACANTCAFGAHSSPMCVSGGCQITCDSGFGDCDGDPRNGCEVDLNRSTEHCGRCANRCGGGANANPVCAGGMCGLSCNAGFSDCDVNLGNGCEADLNNSVTNCRTCGNVCGAPAGATATCGAGVCDFRCDAGLLRCGAQCVRPNDPAFGCGTCTACALAPHATAMACAATGCVPASCAAGYKLCGTQCVAINDANYGCGVSTCSACALASGASSMMCVSNSCAVATCSSSTHKYCGGSCVALNNPAYGCGATGNCGACAVQNAAAICNGVGGCDYSTCNTGWRDLDGNRANGCETAAPSQVPGLRVWLSVSEPGSLVTTSCTARSEQGCLTRWNNLADAANPAVPFATAPFVWRPRGDGTAGAVLINAQPGYDGLGNFVNFVGDRNLGRSARIGLSSIAGPQYTIYVVDAPVATERMYPVACRPSSIFDTNGALHIGNESATQLRLGHYNNDLNVAANTTWYRDRLLIGLQGISTRSITRSDLSGTITGGDNNTTALTHANDCSIGRGIADGSEYTGLVREVILFSHALSLTQQNLVRTYIQRRYGL